MHAMPETTDPADADASSFAKVALPVPVRTAFTYEVPAVLRSKVFVGCRVEVPFGRRILSGIVVELTDKSGVPRTKPVRKIYETYLPDDLLALTEWIASYYGCSVGEAAQSVLPPLLRRSERRARMSGVLAMKSPLDAGMTSLLNRSRRQLELARRLDQSGGSAPTSVVFDDWGFKPVHAEGLTGKGVATLMPLSGISRFDSMDSEVRELNPDQENALREILQSISTGEFRPLLLQGVTGSGKTELYLRAAQYVLSQGGGCVVLVPEIGLLPQATARYRRAFGAELAIVHSRLTGAERFAIWQKIERGDSRIVLGPRSAVFSPVRNLRLIVVDEEQDDSYKQEEKPRYHARSVALVRGKRQNLTVVLGSATPSAESFHYARNGRYQHVQLPRRVGGGALPDIHFVDMRETTNDRRMLSPYLITRLEANINAGKQSILFLNKRGHARFVQCNACGWTAKCRNCDISLTYHRVGGRMKCHFCGYQEGAATRCPQCGKANLYFAGVGTQRIEMDLTSLFPGVGILRMDADTTSGKDGHRTVLEKFGQGKHPILVGTQMVTKGHHFPNVNLVGVLFAEESLNYPDFRSSERTFRQLIQVAGRAGRSSDRGEVVVQTFAPDHSVFRYLSTYDYAGFMTEELALRRQLKYPPFSRLILAVCAAPDRDTVERVSQRWAATLRETVSRGEVDVLGPVPPPVARVRNRHLEQILIKGRFGDADKWGYLDAFAGAVGQERGGRSVDLKWDVDPESFL
jgi:primosomal protein N' (replication factor Y)